jgi:chromate transporter
MNNIKKLAQLFWVFFKIGSFTFGGGLAMLPLIEKEVVDNRKWVDEHEILDIFAISQSVPGVIAINVCIYIGKIVMGIWGAIAAVIGVVLPAFISILLILILLSSFSGNIYVAKAFLGIRSASAALILLSAIKLSKGSIKDKQGYIIAVISFIIIMVLNVSVVWAILFGGFTGYFIYVFEKRRKR